MLLSQTVLLDALLHSTNYIITMIPKIFTILVSCSSICDSISESVVGLH